MDPLLNKGLDRGLIEFLFNQGTGVAFGIACLILLYYGHKERIKDKNETIERLKSILTERRTDRDALLGLMGEIKAYLTSAKAFQGIAREAVRESLEQEPNHRRRKLDTFIRETLNDDDS